MFAQHNLLTDPPFSRLDLIICRNLLIYLEPAMQQKVIDTFHFGLKGGRFLFLGNSESVGHGTDLFQSVSKRFRIFRRIGAGRHDRPLLRSVTSRSSPFPETAFMLASSPDSGAVSRARDLVFEKHVEACALVNRKNEIVSLFGPTHQYLIQPTGPLTSDILAWVRGPNRSKLRNALQTALRKDERVTVRGLRIVAGDTTRQACAVIEQLHSTDGDDGLMLIVFRDESPRSSPLTGGSAEPDEPLVWQLEHELRITREELQSSVEQLESANEELRATNEEILSMNEELQSANEELETSREELQSVNEELNTVNNQLESKVAEQQQTNDDLANLLTSTDIPTLFLDRQLLVRRFTPAVTRLFRLIPSDVGRPLSDVTWSMTDESLLDDARAVVKDLTPAEAQVRTPNGRVFIRRVLPYRSTDDRIEGVVVTYIDITERSRASEEVRDARNYAEAIVETVREPLIVLDENLIVQSANAAYYRVFEATAGGTIGKRIYDIGNGEWNIPDLRRLLEELLPLNHALNDYEVRQDFGDIGPRIMCLNARALPGARHNLILLAIEDITIRIEAEKGRNEVLRQMVIYEENERHRLALELHDETGQHVTAFLLGLGALLDVHDGHPERRSLVLEMQKRAEELARQLHGISLQLRPTALDDHGLERALANYVEDVTMRHHLDVDLHTSGSGLGRLPSHVETVLYRVTQEAITNILKHARAHKVSVLLAHKAREVSLIIEDDGEGFDADAMLKNRNDGSVRLGLRGMRERVILAGGTLTVESHPGKGTALFARVPLSRDDEVATAMVKKS
ncbi:MAG: PAS domain-containing protein [Gemmatimonadota bacterium]